MQIEMFDVLAVARLAWILLVLLPDLSYFSQTMFIDPHICFFSSGDLTSHCVFFCPALNLCCFPGFSVGYRKAYERQAVAVKS